MNKKEKYLTFEDPDGHEVELLVVIEWHYSPATSEHPDESYVEVLNMHEMPEWLSEQEILEKIDSDFYEREEQEYDPDIYYGID